VSAVRRILVVNLTRFGDLLQTSPVIVGLRAQHPGARITALVPRNFVDVAEGLPAVDDVRPFDFDGLARLLLAGKSADIRAAYAIVEGLVAELRAERFDLAVNYSSSRMSAVLLGLVGATDTRGWTMTPDGHRLITHPWSRVFSGSCLHRRQQPFNLVDYYKRAAGVVGGPQRLFFDVPAAARARAAELLAAEGAPEGTPLVALQLAASREVRRWPTASFVALGRALHERLGARMVLIGGGGDRPYAEEVAAALGPMAIDVCGRTSIAELGAVLERSRVLVTGDTGPMHMAVAVGTPVVSLFFGPALPFDTGPYGADHLCLHADVPCAPCGHSVTCLDPFCRDTIAPEAVAEAVVARSTGDWAALEAAADRFPAVRWYRTGFDAEGLFDLERLGSAPIDRREQLRRVYRAVWKHALDGTLPQLRGPRLEREAATLRALVPLAAEGGARAAVVENLARRATDLVALEDAARRVEESAAELYRFGAMHEPAAFLVQVFRFDKENIAGDGVAEIARATRVLHEELARRARLLADLLDPPAVAPRAVPAGGGYDARPS
jgi:ADP-heptose:LPS heptosyltransferase